MTIASECLRVVISSVCPSMRLGSRRPTIRLVLVLQLARLLSQLARYSGTGGVAAPEQYRWDRLSDPVSGPERLPEA